MRPWNQPLAPQQKRGRKKQEKLAHVELPINAVRSMVRRVRGELHESRGISRNAALTTHLSHSFLKKMFRDQDYMPKKCKSKLYTFFYLTN